jgi:sulfur carrier protein
LTGQAVNRSGSRYINKVRGGDKMQVNGKEYALKENRSLVELLKDLKVDPNRIVVEINYEIVNREDIEGRLLNEDDSIEIISFMGGGSK